MENIGHRISLDDDVPRPESGPGFGPQITTKRQFFICSRHNKTRAVPCPCMAVIKAKGILMPSQYLVWMGGHETRLPGGWLPSKLKSCKTVIKVAVQSDPDNPPCGWLAVSHPDPRHNAGKCNFHGSGGMQLQKHLQHQKWPDTYSYFDFLCPVRWM